MILRFQRCSLCAVLLLGCGAAHAQGWLETRIAIEELVVEREFEAAFELGDDYLAQLEATFGPSSGELADAHLMLASLYRQRARHDDAEREFLRAIAILESRDGAQAPSMIEPLIALGETYFDAAQYDLSLASFDEARAIGRRANGLLNLGQIEIVERMSIVHLARGDFDAARDMQREAVAIVQRAKGEKSVEFVDAQFRLANWYMRIGRVEDARRVFLDVEASIRKEFADDPLLSVRLLRSVAMAKRNADPRARSGSTRPIDLEKALDIVRSLESPDPVLEAEVLRDIGDWNVALAIPQDIAPAYEAAWAALDAAEDGFVLQHEWFGPLTMLSAPPFQSPIFSRDPDAPWGRIEIAFTIDTQGRAGDIRIEQSVPANLLDGAAIRQIMRTKFRPRMEDGRVVASEAVLGWDYQYDPAYAERVTANLPVAGAPGAP